MFLLFFNQDNDQIYLQKLFVEEEGDADSDFGQTG